MPDQSSNRAALRLDGHKVLAYAAFFTGASVLTGVVSMTQFFGVADEINYTTSTGSSANVRRGYRVIIKNSAGAFKFATTVRASGTISSTVLPIREAALGSVQIVAGDLIEVRSVMQPGDKLALADSTFAPDGLAYTNQNSVVPPVCCSGGAWTGFVDAGQTYATVPFVGSTSYALDEDSGGDLTHAWTAATATGTTTSTSADPSFTFPVGEHIVIHTVTDDDNSATHTQVISVKVFDATTRPYEILLDSPPSTDEQNGAACTIELFENATLTDIPDGTLCIIFMRETINGVVGSYGSSVAGRSHILMSGYTNGDTFGGADGLDTLTMDIVSPLAWYAETLGLSKVGLRESAPDNWQEIEGLHCWMMCIQILRWYTWVTESWDCILHEYLDSERFPAFFIQEMDAIAQVREIIEGLSGRFVELRHGRFEAQPRLELMRTAHRDLQPTTLIHGDDDTLEYEFRRDHRRRVKIVRTRALRAASTVSESKPLLAKWPGDAPGSGTGVEVIERLIRFSPDDNYEGCGLYGAFHDRIFEDSDGAVHHAPEGRLTIPGYFIYDLHGEWIEFDPAMQTNLRGVDLSDFRWIITGITYEIDEQGCPTTILQIKAETHTTSLGVDDTPPAEGDTGIGDIDWTPPSSDLGLPTPLPPLITTGFVFGKDRLAAFDSGGHLRRTFNFEYATPTYDDQDLSGTVGSTVLRWRYDANPANRDTAGFLVTPTEVWRVINVFGTPVLTLLYTFAASSSYRSIDVSFGAGGPGLFIAISSYYATDGTRVTVSRDGGATWSSEVVVTGVAYAGHATAAPGIAISSKVAGRMYTTAFTDTLSDGNPDIYVSDDYGATWAVYITLGDEDLSGNMHIPWHDNPLGEVVYWGVSNYTGADPQTRYLAWTADGTTITRTNSVDAGPHFNRDFGISSSPNNRLRMAFATTNRANSVHRLAYSTDGGATRTNYDTSGNYTQVALIDDNRNLAWGLNGSIGYSAVLGGALVSKIGNISTVNEIIGVTS